jgi:outer membrane protein TolC
MTCRSYFNWGVGRFIAAETRHSSSREKTGSANSLNRRSNRRFLSKLLIKRICGPAVEVIRGLFNSNSKMWGLSLPVNWSIFSGGKVLGNIRVQEERAEQALLSYRQSILKALEEVESSILAFNQEQIRLEALQSAVKATIEAVHLVLVQYNTGLTEFNNVMMMQRNLLQLQDQLVKSEAKRIVYLITIYKAMGGGW